ncbi:MAG: phosphate ABC transporter permease subunit PstC [Propionibacteriaceae bacterium]|nr:phosphate ABC transporter permease subunit PstC [Propionibacteriaceae bacterium]
MTNQNNAKRSRVFFEASARFVVLGAGVLVMGGLFGVALFLVLQGWPAITATSGLPRNAANLWELAAPLAFGSVWAATIALILAIPVALSCALALTEYLPKQLSTTLGAVIDVLAAIPSVVYGLWGIMVLAPMLAGPYGWMGQNLGWIPLFAGEPSATGRTILTAGLVLAVMIMPIMTAISREVFAQAPKELREASIALGATKWEMIRMVVLPYGRSGMISGAMLALGRALGETMAVAMVLSAVPGLISFELLTSSNPNTVAAFIAQNFPEAHGLEVSALIALGLALFVITFVVNGIARKISNQPSDDAKPGLLARVKNAFVATGVRA